jgi:hypothetical protein
MAEKGEKFYVNFSLTQCYTQRKTDVKFREGNDKYKHPTPTLKV